MLDLQVVSVDTLSDKYVLIKLTYGRPLPSMVLPSPSYIY